ncbi:hypothetical protein [Planctomonas psychrotolerans]|uniref:hypothetical protein n=1 Tax=Planctomonas psychrotolerans TaxID=2528712 RepID=UPI001238634C|nr:hypothetical protein [Planctomonas psychrotolerans]
MQIYSASPLVRARQATSDVLALAAIALFTALGVATSTLVSALADLGKGIEVAGEGFRSTMTDAASSIDDIPLVGRGASAPFDDASRAGAALVAAGQEQQQLVADLALIAGVLVAVVPIALIVRFWLRNRVRFVRRATAARALAASTGGMHLLALRALSTGRDADLLGISADPVGDWRRGDAPVVQRLADLELRSAGVSRPGTAQAGAAPGRRAR